MPHCVMYMYMCFIFIVMPYCIHIGAHAALCDVHVYVIMYLIFIVMSNYITLKQVWKVWANFELMPRWQPWISEVVVNADSTSKWTLQKKVS